MRCVIFLFIIVAFLTCDARAQTASGPASGAPRSASAAKATSGKKNPTTATLADLSFIAGKWQGTHQQGQIEEHWSAPLGDSMMGMFRLVQNGRTTFYEMMVIEQGAAGPVLKIKHYDSGLIGWEERGEVNIFPLISLDSASAIFEAPDGNTRLVFKRKASDALTVTLEKNVGDASGFTNFDFKRLP